MNQTIKNIKEFVKDSPFKDLSGFEITDISEGTIEATIDLTEVFRRHDGIAHGGYISYFADTIMGFAALSLLDDSKTVYTAEMKVSFLNPGLGEQLHGKASVIKSGKTIHFCEAEVFGTNSKGEQYLSAKASGTMVVANKLH